MYVLHVLLQSYFPSYKYGYLSYPMLSYHYKDAQASYDFDENDADPSPQYDATDKNRFE